MSETLIVGVDGGASKTLIRVESAQGDLIGETRVGPANIARDVGHAWHVVMQGLHEILTHARLASPVERPTFHACMGMAGFEVPSAVQEFLKTSKSTFDCIELISDAHASCIGAHGLQDGAIIALGTGVNAYQIESNKTVQVSGWGFPHADEGGGAWLGKEAIRYTCKAVDQRLAFTPLLKALYERFDFDMGKLVTWAMESGASEFATLAPLVIYHAERSDPIAKSLMAKAAEEVELIAKTLLKRQHSLKPLPCALTGGLSASIRPYLSDELIARLSEPKQSAAKGAVLLARKLFLNIEA